MVDRWCWGGYWVCLSSSRRRADLPYSAVYWVHVCSCVRRLPQSFIKGSTLKGQLNYSLLTGGGVGDVEEMVGMAMLLLSDAALHPIPHSDPPSEMRAPPCFWDSSINSSTPLRLLLWLGLKQMIVFCVCVLISVSLSWQRPSASAGDESAFHCFSLHAAHLGEVHPLLNPTFDPAPRLLDTLDLDQTTSEHNLLNVVLCPTITTTHRHTNWICSCFNTWASCANDVTSTHPVFWNIWLDEWEEATLALLRCDLCVYVSLPPSSRKCPLNCKVQCSAQRHCCFQAPSNISSHSLNCIFFKQNLYKM